MASSNVEYYEKQKQLQDKMTSCEQERMDLDRQLRIALQADQTSSKMKAARLHSYWKKICEDEKKAKQRNEMLAREFERIDAHMAQMNARTMRLAHMKKQYEDYIARTYPEWNELMYGKPQSQPVKEDSHRDHQDSFSQQESEPNSFYLSPAQQKQPDAQQEQGPSESKQFSSPVQAMTLPSHLNSLQHNHNDEDIQNTRHESLQYSPEVNKMKADNEEITSQDVGVYQNLPSARSESQKQILIPIESLQNNHQATDESLIYQNDGVMSQPVQSVDIQSRSSGHRLQSASNSMQPALEEEDEDEDTSEFGTESEIPMGQSLQNTQIRVDSVEKKDIQSSPRGVIKPELTIEGLLYLMDFMENDMTEAFSVEGYYRSSIPETVLKNDIVRKANSNGDLSRVDANHISMVILEQITLIVRSLAENCLIPESLLQENFSSLNPTRLRLHLSSEAQIVWDALFGHFVKLVKAQVMEPPLLSAIFTPCLVVEGGSQDKAHTFIVQLLEGIDSGPPQTLQQTNKSLSPAATMEGSGSFVDNGNVPRLKFGSLLDKPSSDDESSFINSLPRDPVPLNETAAYKNMVSTGGREKPKHQTSFQEDTDDDVEKQIATAITKPAVIHQSPRKKVENDEPSETSSLTLQTTSHVYVPTALEPKSPRRPGMGMHNKAPLGVKISSDLDTDTEVDAAIFGSSRHAEDNHDFDFYD